MENFMLVMIIVELLIRVDYLW